VQSLSKLIWIAILLVTLSACSLPRGAALQSEVLAERDSEVPSFQVVSVTRQNIPDIKAWPATGWAGKFHWPKASNGGSSAIIRTGDQIDVTVWDSQDNSLLTNPGERFTAIGGVEVDPAGSIFLPYINKVGVRGLTPSQARAKIQSRLEPIVPSAQVQISLQQGRDHSIDVVGGVAEPGAYPMQSSNYKILNVLADAGGIPPSLRNPRVRLLRGTETYEISADALFDTGAHNVLLYPRDTVIVEQDQRSFTALGATGTEDMVYFPKDRLSALEAMSLIGGLSEARADLNGVLVLREYAAKALRPDGSGPGMQQVVFTFDLTSADGLFAARNFEIQPDDTVLATESPVTSAQTVFGLVGSTLGLTRQVAVAAN
jgi:polysaccharide export outer membrane protein